MSPRDFDPEAPTVLARALTVPSLPRRSKKRTKLITRIAIVAVMLMLFEVGLIIGHRPAAVPLPQPTATPSPPRPIELAPIELAPSSVVGSDGAGLRPGEPQTDRAVR